LIAIETLSSVLHEISQQLSSGRTAIYTIIAPFLAVALTAVVVVILPVVLYGCETWSLTVREEHKPRVFEDRVLRRIFGVKGGWRKLHNEELHNLYSSPSIIRIIKSRRMRWAGQVAIMGEKRNVYRLFVGKPEGKRPLGRPRRRWIDNIKMDLLEIGFGVVDFIGLAQDRYRRKALVNSAMNLRVL
jgi:hypothetical protein